MSVLVSTLQGHKNTIYMGIPYECPSVILAWSQVQKNRMFVHKWPLWPYAKAAVYSYEQHEGHGDNDIYVGRLFEHEPRLARDMTLPS